MNTKFICDGADYKIIKKFGKSFEVLTLDTVKGFLQDSRKSKFKICEKKFRDL